MTISEFQFLINEVLWSSFIISFLLGFLAQRSHFCTMGAIADVYLMGDWGRAFQWMIASAITILGFGVLSVNSQIDPTNTLYFSTKWSWASTIVGGLLFGFGMVLSSGCGLKSLVRAGSGNLKSLIVLIVMGVFAFMTIKGLFAVVRVATVDQLSFNISNGATWPNLFGYESTTELGWTGIIISLITLCVILGFKQARQASNWFTGLGVGALFVAIWWVSGHLGYVSENPDTLEELYVATKSARMEAFSFVGPVAYFFNWLEFYSDQSNVLSLGVASVIGVFTGSLVSALSSHTFKWEGFKQVEDLGLHLTGAALMGVGGVTALGCSVGQGISGISTLSINATSALVGILLGAWTCLVIRSRG